MLSNDVARYVALQRRLGIQFNSQKRTLELYANFAETQGDRYTLAIRIYDWCASASSPNRAQTWFEVLRRFCIFLNSEDPRHEIPPANVFGRSKRPRPVPYILQPDQIRAIMRATLDLPPKGSITPLTYHHLFGLLAATGLRISEALALKHDDLTDDGLVVKYGKFRKSRLVPIDTTTRRALTDYLAIRLRLGGHGNDMFVVTTGQAPDKSTASRMFLRIARQLGFRGPPGTRGPRMHDLRHTFAARSLEACAHDRTAVAHHMAALSTYLGHVDVKGTYWYLEATPVLMHGIAAAGERLFDGGAK
jgi:integrase